MKKKNDKIDIQLNNETIEWANFMKETLNSYSKNKSKIITCSRTSRRQKDFLTVETNFIHHKAYIEKKSWKSEIIKPKPKIIEEKIEKLDRKIYENKPYSYIEKNTKYFSILYDVIKKSEIKKDQSWEHIIGGWAEILGKNRESEWKAKLAAAKHPEERKVLWR